MFQESVVRENQNIQEQPHTRIMKSLTKRKALADTKNDAALSCVKMYQIFCLGLSVQICRRLRGNAKITRLFKKSSIFVKVDSATAIHNSESVFALSESVNLEN